MGRTPSNHLSSDIGATTHDASDTELLSALMRSYKKYRCTVFALGTCCVALLGAAMALYKGGVIDGDVQFAMIMGSYVFVAAVLFIAFARVRPLKADIRARDEALKKEQRSSQRDGKNAPEKANPETPTSLAASSKHPPTPEYRRTRRLWRALIIIAIVIMFSAMALIRLNPDDLTIPIVVLCTSYVFLIGAVYLEIKQLKPQRTAWQKEQSKKKKSTDAKAKAGRR